jgi:hypothetical protein
MQGDFELTTIAKMNLESTPVEPATLLIARRRWPFSCSELSQILLIKPSMLVFHLSRGTISHTCSLE